MPLLGLFVVGFAFFSLDANALTLGCVWLAIGLVYMLYLKFVSKVQIGFPQESGI